MLVKLGAGILAAILALMSAGVLFLMQGGFATVYVHDDDMSLYLPVPLACVELALVLLPDEELNEIRRQLEPVRDLVIAALEELAKAPDAVFVEIQSRDERVSIRKEGSDVLLDIHENGGDEVRVKFPLRSVGRVFAALAGTGSSDSGSNS